MVAFNQDPPPYDGQMDNGHVNTAYNGDTPSKAADKEREVQERSQAKVNDPWAIVELVEDSGPKWSEMSTSDKAKRILLNTSKICLALSLLYMFICSLDFLSASFRLIAGKTTGDVLNNEYVRNPVVGLMIGILVTVLVQSSSTSTSIIVSMVSAGILDVHVAVPMIMGSNIGTSVTNTIVSLTQVGDRNEFRRAFAGATVHDMFNWMTVFTLLIIEIATGMLEKMTTVMVADLGWATGGGGEVKLLKYITEPFTKIVIQLDKEVLNAWGTGEGELANETSLIKHSQVGIILLIGSLLILCTALVLIVKILNSMMKGKMAVIIKKTINADIPYVPWLTGYIAILVGAVMTFLVQSSSIFTSTLTPLIGIGVISVERSYPLTLGSNIGTTTTALLAAMAGEGEGLVYAIQIALVHLFFNIFGILLFYPIPFMRFPIPLAKKLGDTTAKYRWFAIMYLIVMFFILPGFIFLLSLGGPYALYFVGLPLLILFVLVVILNIMQIKCPQILPNVLKNWNWLPKPLHSLSPYDKCCLALPCCKTCRTATEESNELEKVEVEKPTGLENQGYDSNDTRF
ncbi:sodium-dependent phosphate transporter [Penaeus vannamei]|uniref:Sodium-dependent phosphate transporter n=1 Tax=Penaeus vannamei TaxID=6689 RepID=A0A423TZ68_PENVA|nr:sodium-dependent phosphate transporter [Penaeus vannamei]